MGKRSQDKGKRFERWVARWLAQVFPRARRSANQSGPKRSGKDPDIVETPYWVEVKHDNSCSIWALMKQARGDRLAAEDKRPIVGILKHDRRAPIVTMDYDEWFDLMCAAQAGNLLHGHVIMHRSDPGKPPNGTDDD
jgi:hypothetical protein